jgi:hypothetical protein
MRLEILDETDEARARMAFAHSRVPGREGPGRASGIWGGRGGRLAPLRGMGQREAKPMLCGTHNPSKVWGPWVRLAWQRRGQGSGALKEAMFAAVRVLRGQRPAGRPCEKKMWSGPATKPPNQ